MAFSSSLHKLWYFGTQLVVRAWNDLFFGLRVVGTERIPTAGPLVLLANHQSNWDPPLVGTACPRMLNFLAKEDLFEYRPLRVLIESFNAIPLDREGGGLTGIKETLKRLKRNEAVLIFPEGTRSPDGELQPLKAGFLTLVRRSGATILPVILDGMFTAWPRKQKLPRPGRTRVEFGHALGPEEIAAQSDEAILTAVAAQWREMLARNRTAL